jgi:hypothetical protein
MHATLAYRLSQAHLARLRHQAQRGALARAAHRARRARPHQSSHPGPALAALARPVLAVQVSRHHSIAPTGTPRF